MSTVTIDDVLKANEQLENAVSKQVRDIFELFPNANYDRGDVIVLSSAFKELDLSELLTDRLLVSPYIIEGYIVLNGKHLDMYNMFKKENKHAGIPRQFS